MRERRLPAGERLEWLWPGREERRLLGRFYIAEGLIQTLGAVLPFQFVYLFLTLDRPEWAAFALMAWTGTFVVAAMPTSRLADRYRRKPAAIAGGTLQGLSLLLVPAAAALHGGTQLTAVCGCLALRGLGEALATGADEGWVVDNLVSARRTDLVDRYFTRLWSFGAAGAVLASGFAFTLLAATQGHVGVIRTLDVLWYLGGVGQIVGTWLCLPVPERRPPSDGAPGDRPPAQGRGLASVRRMLLRRPALLALLTVIAVAAFADAGSGEAFALSLVTKGLSARGFSVLGVVEGLIGIGAPTVALTLARRLGAAPLLAGGLALCAAAVAFFFVSSLLPLAIGVYLLVLVVEYGWDPIAYAELHALMPSDRRATISSLVHQVSSVAELGGFALLAVILGAYGSSVQDATPGILATFAGMADTAAVVPRGALGLPVADLAVVVFTFAGLLAIPMLRLVRRPPEAWARGGEPALSAPAGRPVGGRA